MAESINDLINTKDAIHSAFIELLNLQVELMENGETIMAIPMHDNLLNSNKMVHGGVIATLADCAAAAAVRTVVGEKIFTPTIDLHINYLSPALKDRGDLYGYGKVITKGKSIAHARADIKQGEHNVAHAIGVFRILESRN